MGRLFRQQWKDYIKIFRSPHDLFYKPDILDMPVGKRIVVFSPHFDDDVFGCGGTLYKHVQAGSRVVVIYLTDGREGDPDEPNKCLVEQQRKEEARNATKILGIEELIFLDQPETRLRSTPKLLKKLKEILTKINPDLIYVPSFLENHIDHFELNRILIKLDRIMRISANVCAYEIWTPIIPNIVVDVGELISIKKQAMACYESQMKHLNYIEVILGLQRYRSASSLKGNTYAEAFIYTFWDDYIKFMRKINLNKRLLIKK